MSGGASQPSQPSSSELPIWHTFNNIFNGNCLPDICSYENNFVLPNCGLYSTLLTCNYKGTSYYGYYESGGFIQYCNISPNGVIPEVNGTSVPYLGCVLSRAPINYLFSDLYSLTGSGTSISMLGGAGGVFAGQVTVYPTENFQLDSCSVQTNIGSTPTGNITCDYLGSVYSGLTSNTCNVGTPIQVNGIAIPLDACMLQRN